MTHARSPLLYLFLIAPVFYLLALIGFPILYNVAMSFQEVTLGNLGNLVRPFVGLDNFREVVADPTFRKVFVNSLIFVAVNVVGQVSLGLLAALFFAESFAGAHFLRGLLLATWMLPGLVVGALWKWMFASQYGVVNYVLAALHLTSGPVHWLSDPAVAMTTINIAHIWYIMPFSMILIAAALTGIPQELYEAAALDGAGPVARFRYIVLPALRPTLLAVACLVTIYSMRAFDMIFALTQGGPLDASNVLPLLSYQFSFQQFKFGIGATVGTFAVVFVFAVALIYVRTLKMGGGGVKAFYVSKRARSIAFTVIGFAGATIYLFPIYWMLISGFKTSTEIFANPPTFFPKEISFYAFHSVFVQENMPRFLRNSFIIAVPVVALTLILGSMGAYALCRIRSRLVDVALVIILLLQVFPEALIATPMFIIFKYIGLLNTHLAVILATTSKMLAFALIVLRPMFLQVPIELEEAALVDGCTRLQTFYRIVLPLMRIPLMVVGAIAFAQAYGQFVYPITLLNRAELQPGSVGIYGFIGAEFADWHRVMAFASIYVLPVLALFLLLQRQIVAGLTAGALK